MTEAKKPPKDPELDAAVLRVPHWRALGLALAMAVLVGPVIYFLSTRSGAPGTASPDWLEGSVWRIVEIERRSLPREGQLAFRQGRMVLTAGGCPPREVPYELTNSGIRLTLPADAMAPARCGEPAIDEVWSRLPRVVGVTRFATGLALTDKDGRDLVRTRR